MLKCAMLGAFTVRIFTNREENSVEVRSQLIWIYMFSKHYMFGPCFVMQYLSVLSSFAFISLRKRELVSCCHIAVIFLCLFLAVP